MRTATEAWVEIGRADDVPLWEGRRVTVAGRRIAVFRTDAGLYAIDGECPHAGGPLQDGLVADDCVTCPLHGRRYSLRSGERRAADGTADPAGPGLARYAVTERKGALLLRLPPDAPAPT